LSLGTIQPLVPKIHGWELSATDPLGGVEGTITETELDRVPVCVPPHWYAAVAASV